MAPSAGRLRARAAVLNRAAGLGVYQRYRRDQLPHHITWRQLGSGTYVVAMEPSTNRDAGRFDARERGELGLPGAGRRAALRPGDRRASAAVRSSTSSRRGRPASSPCGVRAAAIAGAAGWLPQAPPRLSAGILTADLTRLGAELERDARPRAVRARRRHGRQLLPAAHRRPGRSSPRSRRPACPVDAHLLVDEPARFLPEVVAAGAGHRDGARGGQPAPAPGAAASSPRCRPRSGR